MKVMFITQYYLLKYRKIEECLETPLDHSEMLVLEEPLEEDKHPGWMELGQLVQPN